MKLSNVKCCFSQSREVLNKKHTDFAKHVDTLTIISFILIINYQ